MGDHCCGFEEENNFARTTIIMNFVVFALTLQEVPFFLFTSTVGNLESSSSIMCSTTMGDFLWKEKGKRRNSKSFLDRLLELSDYPFSDHFCDIHRICCRFDRWHDAQYDTFHSTSQREERTNWQSKIGTYWGHLYLMVHHRVSLTSRR